MKRRNIIKGGLYRCSTDCFTEKVRSCHKFLKNDNKKELCHDKKEKQ